MPHRVVITGAAGFIGRHVARRFALADWSVIGLGHGTWSREDATLWGIAEWHPTDISFDALSNLVSIPDAIIHCAGSGSVGYSLNHPFQDFHRSAGTVAATLEYMRLRAPHARLVYLSSAAVYGYAGDAPIREDALPAPLSPYGFHKMMGESLCRMYGTQYKVSSVIVRLFSVYGCGLQKQLLWDACCKAFAGNHSFDGAGDETRNWLHVQDAADLIYRAVDHSSTDSLPANGGTGEAPSIRAVLHELFAALHISAAPTFSGMTRHGDPKHYQADVSVIQKWGWVPTVGWRDGIRAYAEWFQSRAS